MSAKLDNICYFIFHFALNLLQAFLRYLAYFNSVGGTWLYGSPHIEL